MAGQGRKATLAGASAGETRLLATLPGIMHTEKVLHKAFARYRVRGEWFNCRGELADFIRLLAE